MPGLLQKTFQQCRYRVRVGRTSCELRVGEPALVLERRIPRCSAFSIITAWNPWARTIPPRHNVSMDRRLVAWLASRQLRYWPALNGEDRWQEDAWLVGNPPLPQLDRLAKAFGQVATLHWRRGQPVALRWHVERTDVMDAGPRAP